MAYADHAGALPSRRRRADRLRPVRLLVQPRARRLLQAAAGDPGARWPSGPGTAAGSFGQFLFPPIGNILIDGLGWQQALVVFAASLLLVLPLSTGARDPHRAGAPPRAGRRRPRTSRSSQALREAFRHRSYVLLVLGFFTCGFQLAFITAHLPAYLKDAGLSAAVGGWTLAVIGLANAVGSLGSGWLIDPHVEALAPRLDLSRALGRHRRLHPAAGLARDARSCSASPSACCGSPPCRRPPSLVMLMFGTRYMAMLYGFAFFSHQVGGFLGVWLGGVLYEAYGNYDARLVALGRARHRLRADQPADRGAAGRAVAGAAAGGIGAVARSACREPPRRKASGRGRAAMGSVQGGRRRRRRGSGADGRHRATSTRPT